MTASAAARTEEPGLIERYFKLRENGTTIGTEVIGGVTTFFVMAYIIALNPIILNYVGVKDLQDKNLGPGFAQTVAMTALCAGILTIAMGLYANRPFAMAAGLGLNAVVAYQLVLGKPPLPWPAAMGIILLEGIAITILVLTNLREAILNAIPLALKRAIGVGIGLFILLIGLVNAGVVVRGTGTVVTLSGLNSGPILTFVIGLLLTLLLFARGIKGALLLGIVGTTIIAGLLHALIGGYVPSTAPDTAVLPATWVQAPDFSNAGRGLNLDAFAIVGPVAALLAVFTIMLSDFFDTMGTVVGIGGQAGWLDERGRLPGIRRILLVDSIGAAFGGLMSASSNTGFLMAGIASKIDFSDLTEGLPALLTIVVMPFTYSITNGVGAGFVSYAFLKLVTGRARDVHPLLWIVVVAFVLYFTQALYAPLFNIGPYRE